MISDRKVSTFCDPINTRISLTPCHWFLGVSQRCWIRVTPFSDHHLKTCGLVCPHICACGFFNCGLKKRCCWNISSFDSGGFLVRPRRTSCQAIQIPFQRGLPYSHTVFPVMSHSLLEFQVPWSLRRSCLMQYCSRTFHGSGPSSRPQVTILAKSAEA
jgi:hypothetical protein